MKFELILEDWEYTALQRKRMGMSQLQMAERLGCSQAFVSMIETGQAYQKIQPHTVLLEPHEFCWIMRRRQGLTLKDLGDTLGVSRVTLIKWEKGISDCERLIKFWEEFLNGN